MSFRSKRYRAMRDKIDKNKAYTLLEAITLIKSQSKARFDESLELHIKLGVDSKKSEQTVKGVFMLPHGTGKSVRIAVFTETQQKEATSAGADIVGGKDLVDELIAGKKINFDATIATPDFMKELTRAAKILGTRGLMPSPKAGTVAQEVKPIIEKLKRGQVQYRNDSTGNIHQIIGKVSSKEDTLEENARAFIQEIRKQKPKGVKGIYLQRITLCSTMGPSMSITA